MRYKKFSIKRYRAVDSAEVPVGNRLIPLIGVNESGKTSILKAILCFDKNSDKAAGREHLEYKNNYVVGVHESSVSADIVIDSKSDLEAISNELGLSEDDELLKELENLFKTKKPLTLERSLNTNRRPYSVVGLESKIGAPRKLAKAIYDLLPLILYFDDFTDRVPENVGFTLTEEAPGYRLSNSRLSEWQNILEEVFSRATGNQHDLLSFIKIDDSDDQDGLLSDINDALDEVIMEDWRRLKKARGSLADDTKNLKLELRYVPYDDGSFDFQFKVADRSRGNRRYFNVVERSKGFQWFFNFLMKLKFNPKYQNTTSGAIYLLDEPGSYLHSSAQDELLKELEEISNTNTILYCTHSQHLLDPDVINISQTRIVSKEDGLIQVIPFGSAGIDNYQGAMSPLYQALQMRTGAFNRQVKKALITEGITDYYWFSMMRKYVVGWEMHDIDVIPGAGAGNLKELISWSIAWSDSYRVFLDSDKGGKEAFKRYKKFFGNAESENIIYYEIPSFTKDVQLESFLCPTDTDRILDSTKTDHVKSAITELYFKKEEMQSAFFKDLSKTSLGNMEIMKSILQKWS